LRDGGFETEATMVSEGRGDDFAEVRIALSLLRILGERPRAPRRRSSATAGALSARSVEREC
jgi:hypothetical protein